MDDDELCVNGRSCDQPWCPIHNQAFLWEGDLLHMPIPLRVKNGARGKMVWSTVREPQAWELNHE